MSELAIILIKLYQKFISPCLGKHCRFYPTCSEYAVIAIREWGFLKGVYISLKRVLRCNPFNAGGYDPPPKKLQETI
mgnify:CR=1 FL=1